jgi:hypothetical protein
MPSKYSKVNQRNCYVFFFSTRFYAGICGYAESLEKTADILTSYFKLHNVLFGNRELYPQEEVFTITAVEMIIG